jgi:hypothetical protein
MWIPLFWDMTLCQWVKGSRPFEDSVLESSGSAYLLTHRHILGERNPVRKLQHSQNVKISNAESVQVMTASVHILSTELLSEH